MGLQKRPETLNKFLAYMLGRRPDEFGLIPGPEGWLKIKDLLRALSEEPGWKHVRRGHLNEVMLTVSSPSIQVEGERIRNAHWDGAFHKGEAQDLPKLLYVGIRNKTYPEIDKKGIFPVGAPFVIFCRDKDMAVRVGKRRDRQPVILTVNTAQAQDLGVVFFQEGELLYTADFAPRGCFTGPPVPEARQEAPKKAPAPPVDPALSMGAFSINLEQAPAPGGQGKGPAGKKGKGRKKRSWKEEARQKRRRE